MFVFGKPVQGGVSGINPDLSEATSDNNFQIETVQHDYRETFSTLIQNFMGASDEVVNTTFFNNTLESSFTDFKIENLIKPSFEVPEQCFNSNIENDTIELSVNDLELDTHSFKSHINLKTSKNLASLKSYEVFNHLGQLIHDGKITESNSKTLKINLERLEAGDYILKIKSKSKIQRFKIVKT